MKTIYGDFKKVKRFISENILGGNGAISIIILQGIYGIGQNILDTGAN